MLALCALMMLQAAPVDEAALSAAFTALSEQGFPKLGGAKYRSVEVADCGTVAANTVHAWVAADGRTALTWGGLVLPVIKAGAPASLEADLKRLAADPITVMVLHNQSTRAHALKTWSALRPPPVETTPLQRIAAAWAEKLYERAVCSQKRSRDEDATQVLEIIESMTKRGLIERDAEAAALLADQRRREKAPPKSKLAFTAAPNASDLENWVSYLDEVGGQPPIVLPELSEENPPLLAEQPLVLGLAKFGAPIAERLIDATENDRRLSRFARHAQGRARIEPVSEVAFAVLKQLFDTGLTADDADLNPKARARVLRERWAVWQVKTPAERAVLSLEREDEQRWPWAARALVSAIDSGDSALEALRARKTVTALLVKRIEQLENDCELPRALYRWSPEASMVPLNAVLERSKKYGHCLAWVSGALADAGQPQALEALALRLRGPSSVDDEMVLMACERTEHTGLQRALTAMLAERTPRLRWNKQREWKPLLKCPLMKAFVLRQLSEMKPSKLDGTYRRVADAYANSLSLHLPSAPQFELAAPQPQRDASLKAMRAWLAE